MKRKNTPRVRGEDAKPHKPDSNEQSGSTGRRAADEDVSKGKDTGQDHYGQSGFAGPEEAVERKVRRRP